MRKIIGHLDKTRQKLLDSVSDLPQEKIDYTPLDGGWSIGEVLQHLYITEKTVHSMFQRLVSGELKSKKLLWDRIRKLPVSWVLFRGIKIKTFKKLRPIGQKPKKEIFSDLARSRDDVKRFLQEHEKQNMGHLTYPHFILGELNIGEWLYFVGYHEERHRKQIKEIKKEVNG